MFVRVTQLYVIVMYVIDLPDDGLSRPKRERAKGK